MSFSTVSESTRTILLNALTISLLFTVLGSDGLRDVRLEAKQYFRQGEDAMLRCSYDLESDDLYAVKWYKGQSEFYRFIPKESKPRQIFPVTGISVDYFQSDDHHVILKNVSFDTFALPMKCVVSEDRTFQTLEDFKEVKVIVVGYDSPKLYLEKDYYRPGDIATANCTVDKTSVAVNITWFINEKPVSNDKIITRVVEEDTHPWLTSTISMLMFRVPIDSLDPTYVKCMGQVYDLYREASVIKIQPRGPIQSRKVNTPDSLQHSSAQDPCVKPVATNSFRIAFLAQILWRVLHKVGR